MLDTAKEFLTEWNKIDKRQMKEIDIGLIGGYGLVEGFSQISAEKRKTKFGEPSSDIRIVQIGPWKVGVIARHGEKHTIPPHKINYRANIMALKELGATKLITTSAVGSLKEDYKPGQLVVTDQVIDFTKKREYTFFDGPVVHHVSFEPPFCESMRKLAIEILEKNKIAHQKKGIYICIEGPRFSTKAESHMFSNFADIIGMTLCPEASLAREAELCCLNIAMVTDYDVWKEHKVSAELVLKTVSENEKNLKLFLKKYIEALKIEDCACNRALVGTKMTKD